MLTTKWDLWWKEKMPQKQTATLGVSLLILCNFSNGSFLFVGSCWSFHTEVTDPGRLETPIEPVSSLAPLLLVLLDTAPLNSKVCAFKGALAKDQAQVMLTLRDKVLPHLS